MIALIHGEDTTASRDKLAEFKKKYHDAELLTLDGKNLTLSTLVNSFDTTSLFQLKKILIIEKFFTGVFSKEKTTVLKYIVDNQKTGADVVFWEDKKLDKTQLKKLGADAKILVFDLPQLLFKFLDSIGISSPVTLLNQFHQLQKQKESELIFVMILRQVRNLIIAKDLGLKGFGTMPGWQAGKFIQQAGTKTLDDLISWYRRLLRIDYQIKTGQTPFSVDALLDLFFISI
jgi:hypothetical protein